MPTARRTLEWLALAAILGAAAYLRLANGALTPGWYSDEGTHLNVAHNLLLGRTQYLAVGHSTLLFARLPLFEWLLAGALQLAGAGPGGSPERGLMVLRTLTGGLGVLTVLALYWLLRRAGRGLALGAALVYALYPSAVVYSRLGFSYNLLAPLLLAAVWGLWRWLEAPGRARGLAVAALAVGFGALSDWWMLAAVPAVLLVVVVRRPRALAWASALMGLPLAVYLLAGWLAAPAALVTDLRFTLFRVGSRSLPDQLALLADNYASLLAQDGWLALGLVGLFRLCPVRLGRLLLLFFFVPLVLVGRSSSLVSLSFYYLIPLLPLAAAGLAALLVEATPALARWAARSAACLRLPPRVAGWLGWAGALALVGSPLAVALGLGLAQVRSGFATAIDPFLLDPRHARAAADFVDARSRPGDVTLASPGLAWLLAGHAADFQMALAYAGQHTPHLPGDLPRERYVFDASLKHARFAVVDNLWRNWGVYNVPGLPALLDEVQGWRRVFSAGDLAVYERPP